MSFTNKARNFQANDKKRTSGGKGMSACLTREYADAMADVLGGKSPNEVADLAGVTPRAVKNWQAGESGPHGAHLIRLMGAYDDVFQKIMDMTGRMTGPTASPAEREAAVRALKIIAGV